MLNALALALLQLESYLGMLVHESSLGRQNMPGKYVVSEIVMVSMPRTPAARVASSVVAQEETLNAVTAIGDNDARRAE